MNLTKAMILAAGLGTRLRPLTLTSPKALVKINGVPMIEFVLKKLIEIGIKEIVINTHHFAEQIEKYFTENNFPVKINLVYEREILGTGGGIKNAAKFLRDTENFLVHNVDIFSDVDLIALYDFHRENSALASLSVQNRTTSRPLLIDDDNYITGRISENKKIRYTSPHEKDRPIGFCGIHIMSSRIFSHFPDETFFDVFKVYFALIKNGEKIMGCNSGNVAWKDVGKYQEILKKSLNSR